MLCDLFKGMDKDKAEKVKELMKRIEEKKERGEDMALLDRGFVKKHLDEMVSHCLKGVDDLGGNFSKLLMKEAEISFDMIVSRIVEHKNIEAKITNMLIELAASQSWFVDVKEELESRKDTSKGTIALLDEFLNRQEV